MILFDHLIRGEEMVKCIKAQVRLLKTALRWKGDPKRRQRIQMVLLREGGMTQPAIAEAMGASLSTVNRAHMAYDRGGLKALKSKPSGGRKRENMSLAEERALLARFARAAGAGEMLNIHYLIMPTSNTACFQAFLDLVARTFARQDVLLVIDGAPNHRCSDLVVPDNISLLFLPPYAPELNPKENLWDEIREKIFKNYALKSIVAVRAKLKQAILYIERNPKTVQSITSFPYILKSL